MGNIYTLCFINEKYLKKTYKIKNNNLENNTETSENNTIMIELIQYTEKNEKIKYD